MRGFSFETQGEMRAYDRGKQDALEELYAQIYEDLSSAGAFPDSNPQAFAAWGQRFLMPRIAKRRTGDDLFKKLMDLDPS
ncbi:MAG TPA: hypothetical protein VEI97_01890 [bacterium]|nr:hypothetical protein [bacterium]